MSPYCGMSSDAALGNFGSSSIRAGSFARLTSLPCCELGRLSRCLLKGRPLTVLAAGAGAAASGLLLIGDESVSCAEAVELPREDELRPLAEEKEVIFRALADAVPTWRGVSRGFGRFLSLSSMSCAPVNTCGSTPTTHSAAASGSSSQSSDSMHSSRAVSMRPQPCGLTIPVGSTSGRAESPDADAELLGVFSSTELSIGHLSGHRSPRIQLYWHFCAS